MSSAACYINKKRILAESGITKVQYPGRIANNNNVILSVQNCSPNYNILNYISKNCCILKRYKQ